MKIKKIIFYSFQHIPHLSCKFDLIAPFFYIDLCPSLFPMEPVRNKQKPSLNNAAPNFHPRPILPIYRRLKKPRLHDQALRGADSRESEGPIEGLIYSFIQFKVYSSVHLKHTFECSFKTPMKSPEHPVLWYRGF